jgi:O-antigen ligase
MDPVRPNFMGYGDNVTGFRSYLAYFSSFYLLFLMGYLLKTRDQVISLIRWMTIISFFFAAGLSICVFTKSIAIAEVLSFLGLVVTTFDNGFLRFLALPAFGLFLMTVAMLPKVVFLDKWLRWALFSIGIITVVLGGNRIGLVMALAVVVCIPLSQGRFMQTGLITCAAGIMLVIASIIGNFVRGDVGLLRVFSLVSDRLEIISRADDSVRWRQVRWERAWEDIRERPFIGHSYGGLANAFISDKAGDERTIDIDLASGSIHNGYLSCARAFGIPLVLFLFGTILWFSYSNFRMARLYYESDPQLSQLHSLVFAYLVALIPAIGVGADTHLTMLWFILGLGIILLKLKRVELEALVPPKETGSPALRPITAQ